MKRCTTLAAGWEIRQLDNRERLHADAVRQLGAERGGQWLPATMPAQVHEILLAAGKIADPIYPGNARRCLWVGEADWVYRTQFARPEGGDRQVLVCDGLDTLVDVYLNGERVASQRNMYLPLKVDVTERLGASNTLLLHFRSPHAWLAQQTMPAAWEGMVRKNRLLRKPHEDFNDFNGAYPYLTPIGVYADVRLESIDGVELGVIDVDVATDAEGRRGDVRVGLGAEGLAGQAVMAVVDLVAPGGCGVGSATVELDEATPGHYAGTVELGVDRPALWWPRGYGEQPLYAVQVRLLAGGRERDRTARRIGFRHIAIDGRFDLRVNRVPVKLWGANLTPLQGLSHVWKPERARVLLDHAEACHMTSLRVWGPGAPYGEQLYDACDRRGILLWSEMYHTWGMYPDDADYRASCRAEAEQHVRRLKHHASVLLWCGGNEQQMGAELTHPGRAVIGRALYEEDYAEICARLDPGRYYHPNSPWSGRYANDPLSGDSHGYTHIWYVPGADYGVLFTENTRVSTAPLHTLRRVLKERLWPAGFDGVQRGPGDNPLPPSWVELTPGPDFVVSRLGPVESFYDTTDTAEGLVYRLGAGHALWIRRNVERYRRGRPASEASGPRRCMGHYLWKLNNTWPMIYSNVIDYFLEPNMAYYALRRAYAPVLLSFEIGDQIHLWLVNDTPADVAGRVRFALLDISTGAAVQTREAEARVAAGASEPVLCLDELGMFARRHALVGELFDATGQRVAAAIGFADIERHLAFGPAWLTLEATREGVAVTTDRFARCVHLEGDAEGDAFGWHFGDNYFDLLPGERRVVPLRTRHESGRISARARFSPHVAAIEWRRGGGV